MTLKFDESPRKNNKTPLLYYNTFWSSTFLAIFCPRWLWKLTYDLENNKAHLLCCFNLCASFHRQWWIQTGVTVWEHPIWVKIDDFFLAMWPWNLKRWPWRTIRYLFFHSHMWIQTGVTVWKRLNGVMTSVTLTFDFWPWPFAWTSSLSMVIISENFRMIRWEEHCQKDVTDGQTDRRQ